MGRKMTESGLRIDLMGMGYVELVADGRRPVDEHLLVLGPRSSSWAGTIESRSCVSRQILARDASAPPAASRQIDLAWRAVFPDAPVTRPSPSPSPSPAPALPLLMCHPALTSPCAVSNQ